VFTAARKREHQPCRTVQVKSFNLRAVDLTEAGQAVPPAQELPLVRRGGRRLAAKVDRIVALLGTHRT
jgi:hypothetical protein